MDVYLSHLVTTNGSNVQMNMWIVNVFNLTSFVLVVNYVVDCMQCLNGLVSVMLGYS